MYDTSPFVQRYLALLLESEDVSVLPHYKMSVHWNLGKYIMRSSSGAKTATYYFSEHRYVCTYGIFLSLIILLAISP